MIRALLYRLLIISAHLQRHGIRLLIAIGRFNARAPAFGADPPAPFDSEPPPLFRSSGPPFPSRFLRDDRRAGVLRRNPLQLSASEAKGQRLSRGVLQCRCSLAPRSEFPWREGKRVKGNGQNLQEVEHEPSKSR